MQYPSRPIIGEQSLQNTRFRARKATFAADRKRKWDKFQT